MKKIILLIVALSGGILSMAQRCPVRDIAHVDLPEGTKALSHEMLKKITECDQENSGFLKNMINGDDDLYKIDSFFLELIAHHFKAPKNYLEDLKNNFEGMESFHYPPIEIKTVNNYRVLILNIDSGTYGGAYSFICINKNQNAFLAGSLNYYGSGNNQAKCRSVLDELLENIAFKL